MQRLVPIILAAALATIAVLQGGNAMAFELTSTAFKPGGAIPSKYTCDGNDVSPPLTWSGAPAGTKTFAIIADDPDAPVGTWVHWVAWNIPASAGSTQEGLDTSVSLSDGTKQGITDFKRHGYGGPCPPSGTHRYFFKLYALDAALELSETATKKELEAFMRGHVLAEASLMGTYSRKR